MGKTGKDKMIRIILINLGLLIFTVIMLWLKPVKSIRSDYLLLNRFDFAERILVYGDTVLNQEFTGVDGANAVELLLVPSGTSLHGYIRVNVYDDTNRVIGSYKTYKMDISGEGLVGYRLNEDLQEGRTYRLELSAPELDEETSVMVSLGYGEFAPPGIGGLNCSGKKDVTDYCADKVMSLSLYREDTNLRAIIAIIAIFIGVNICLILGDKGPDVYVIPALVCAGLAYVVSFTPRGSLGRLSILCLILYVAIIYAAVRMFKDNKEVAFLAGLSPVLMIVFTQYLPAVIRAHMSTGQAAGTGVADAVKIPEWITLAYAVILLLCILAENTPSVPGLVLFALSCAPYGISDIINFQAGYFIPLLLLLVYNLLSKKLRFDADRNEIMIPVWFVEIAFVVSISSQI